MTKRRWATAGGVVGATLSTLWCSFSKPMINDVTTDPDQPPTYEALQEQAQTDGRSMSYDPSFRAIQQRHYPDLRPLVLEATPAQAFAEAARGAHDLGWTIVSADAETGRIEATESSAIFKFTDDVVIRIRPLDVARTRVDVRSRSRVGKGDLGVNAKRVKRFLQELGRSPALSPATLPT